MKSSELRQLLITYFSYSELRNLCDDLDIDHELVPGDNKEDKARELIAYVERRGQSPELVARIYYLRPNINLENDSNIPSSNTDIIISSHTNSRIDSLQGRITAIEQRLDNMLNEEKKIDNKRIVDISQSQSLIFNNQSVNNRRWNIYFPITKIIGLIQEIEKFFSNKSEKSQIWQDYEGIYSSVLILHNVIAGHLRFTQDEIYSRKLRVTVHRVLLNSNEFEQIVPYAGGDDGGAERRFRIQAGIVGRVIREGMPFITHRQSQDYENYIQELVLAWSYTEKEARSLSSDRQSWMAVPIYGQDGIPILVVYLDSSDKNFFDKKVRERILFFCSGIARFINERYK